MDAESESRFQRIEGNLQNLTEIVLSLGRTSSEHDARIGRLEEVVAGLTDVVAQTAREQAQIARDHEEKFSRVLDIQATLAQAHERATAEMDRLRQAQDRTDEHLAILIRMMDEWIRRNAPNGQGA